MKRRGRHKGGTTPGAVLEPLRNIAHPTPLSPVDLGMGGETMETGPDKGAAGWNKNRVWEGRPGNKARKSISNQRKKGGESEMRTGPGRTLQKEKTPCAGKGDGTKRKNASQYSNFLPNRVRRKPWVGGFPGQGTNGARYRGSGRGKS